ncbi:uncharacterized protein LOC134956785 [Pseudophryne corroboree]|uniref:uncharacterized protein LOC134956785 n=1 Tax=Pseudophryne corroboree TaxID=495146 RepID=UPI0030814CBF
MATNILLMLCIFSLCSAVNADCSTTATNLSGSSATVTCPSGCVNSGAPVYGTDYYTDDSAICPAAIHAGALTNAGGNVTIQFIVGQNSYIETTRNGITTKPFTRHWPRSFTFPTVPKDPQQVNADCSTTARKVGGSSAIVTCPPGCLGTSASVWGTNNYTDDSAICRAAIHDGAGTDQGGNVTINFFFGQKSYNGTTRNGMTSKDFGVWDRTFTFPTPSNPPTPKPTGNPTQSPPDPKYVAQPGDKSACLSITFVKTGKLVTALQNFLCACPENAGQAFNFQEFKMFYFALKAELKYVGCDVNLLLGTKLNLEDLLSNDVVDVEKLTPAVNTLLGGLNLGGVVKLLCNVVTALNTPCVQDLLQKGLPDVTDNIKNALCGFKNSNSKIELLGTVLTTVGCETESFNTAGLSDQAIGLLNGVVENILDPLLATVITIVGSLIGGLLNPILCQDGGLLGLGTLL